EEKSNGREDIDRDSGRASATQARRFRRHASGRSSRLSPARRAAPFESQGDTGSSSLDCPLSRFALSAIPPQYRRNCFMIRALYSAASGMNAQQTNVDNIANNLANANTTGFKMRRAQFQDLLYQSMVQPGTAASQQTTIPAGLQLGLGTRAASNEIIFSQGNFSQTGNPLDLVVQGNGFFQIRLA